MTAASSSDDVFERFNRATGAATGVDPHADLAALRPRGPVHRVQPGTADPGAEFAGLGETYLVVTHAGVAQVLGDAESFSSDPWGVILGPVVGRSLIEMDDPEHRGYRALAQQPFTRRAMERWAVELIRPVVERQLDAIAGKGRAELVRDLTLPFPVTVIAKILGLPDEDLDRFHRWGVGVISVFFDWEWGMESGRQLRRLFAELLADRRRHPRDDLISALAAAELDGRGLTDDEIFTFLLGLLPAGAETTYRLASNLLVGLLTHPDQLAALRADRSLLPQAIEEALRWDPPIMTIPRRCRRATTVEGVAIPEGVMVGASLGAANRDPARYPDPDRFDVTRAPQPQMAFGFGPHMCLGMHLARAETAACVDALLTRLPDLRLDPDAGPVAVEGTVMRAPARIPVVFTPA